MVAALSLTLACGEQKPGTDQNANKAASGAVERVGNLVFHRDEPTARQQAKSEGRLLFIDFYADWCVNCKLWSKLAVKDQKLNTALQKAVLLKIYDTDAVFSTYQNDKRFGELLVGLPFFLILAPDGSVRYKSQDYKDVRGMVQALNSGS